MIATDLTQLGIDVVVAAARLARLDDHVDPGPASGGARLGRARSRSGRLPRQLDQPHRRLEELEAAATVMHSILTLDTTEDSPR